MKISFVGSGNVATHLAALLQKAGHTVEFIYSPVPAHARILASKVSAKATGKLSEVIKSGCVIIAVKDDAIKSVINLIPASDCLVLHTSGTESLALLKSKFRNAGVLYPVQSFSRLSPPPQRIPFCIEATNTSSLKKIKALSRSVSKQVKVLTSEERRAVHLAAVFANNFTNYILTIAEKILRQKRLGFNLLNPLIEETVSKAVRQSPALIQTGPAARNDSKTIKAHLAMLKNNKEYKAVYKLLSQNIITGRKVKK